MRADLISRSSGGNPRRPFSSQQLASTAQPGRSRNVLTHAAMLQRRKIGAHPVSAIGSFLDEVKPKRHAAATSKRSANVHHSHLHADHHDRSPVPGGGRAPPELREEGFGILCEIDVQATLRQRLGVDGDPYLILGALQPPLAHQTFETEPAANTRGHIRDCPVQASGFPDGDRAAGSSRSARRRTVTSAPARPSCRSLSGSSVGSTATTHANPARDPRSCRPRS